MGESTLSPGPSTARLYELVDQEAALGAACMEHRPPSPNTLACQKGCSTCCSRPIVTTAPSVLRLAAWLRERLSADELSEVFRRVIAVDEVTHGKTLTLEDRPPTPCALLVDGACSVYEVRPFVCRAWNSYDVEPCKVALVQQDVRIPTDGYQRTVYAAVEEGLKRAVGGAGLDDTPLELMASLRVALERPDASEAWLAGKPVFADCKAKLPDANRRRLPVS